MRVNVVSLSGGKDSTATELVRRVLEPDVPARHVFADTGNEHEATIEYATDYLPRKLGIKVDVLRVDFTDWWWRRRDYIRDVYPTKLVEKEGYSVAEADELIRRCLAVFERGPSGVPFLDLCVIKGRFPSRKAQFCTEFLKTKPLTEYAIYLIDQGHAVWSWQGVRGQESESRARRLWCPLNIPACDKNFEDVGGGLFIYRPILRWSALDTFEVMKMFGIEPNPLYKLGMGRVGCMPCVNTGKDEILEISKRFPDHIDRIEEWEAAVRIASKRGGASFFPAPDDGRGALVGDNIRKVIQWSRTSRGGRQISIFADDAPSACSSSYGLCDSAEAS